MTYFSEEINELARVSILMAQELQEFVDDAIDASGDGNALRATQDLLDEWEQALADSGIEPRWQDVLANGERSEELRL